MRFSIYLIPIVILGLLCDWIIARHLRERLKKHTALLSVLQITHWTVAAILSAYIITIALFGKQLISAHSLLWTLWGNAFYALFYVPKFIYGAFCFFAQLVYWISKAKKKQIGQETLNERALSRRQFVRNTGITFASLPFATMIYGTVVGRFHFRIHRLTVTIPNLPESFKGAKIIQISDTHLGSFGKSFDKIRQVVQVINNENADIIVHTGDLVNNFASEIVGWEDVFKELKASRGKFAVMGNHDYGNYCVWNSIQEKEDNLNGIKQGYANCGFQLLLNTHVKLTDSSGKSVAIVGVENWGEPPFPQLGNLEQAMVGTELCDARILLTHNPKHWEHQVMNGNWDLPFTLSGHTHGMQMGLQWNNHDWSICSWGRYKRWGGLYTEGKKQLYVNRGLGYLGLPMRMGMDPEITVITLS